MLNKGQGPAVYAFLIKGQMNIFFTTFEYFFNDLKQLDTSNPLIKVW